MADFKKEVNVSERPIDDDYLRTLTSEEREAQEDAEMKLEAQANNNSSQASLSDEHWKPGFLNRFPWMGFGALIFIVLAAGACVLTLSLADGVSQKRWPKQIAPNVIVNILNSAANLCFGIAIGNGVAIAWWRKTLQGASIEQLNRSWKFSSSIKDVVLGAKYFNIIALAALTTKFTIIDGSLLQRAFTTEIRQDIQQAVNFTGYANLTIPMTGVTSTRSETPGILAKNFNDDLKIWAQGAGVLPNIYAGCNGLCFVDVPAAGFEFDCSEANSTAIDYGSSTPKAQQALSDDTTCNETARYTNETCDNLLNEYAPYMFKVDFEAVYNDPAVSPLYDETYSYITMNMLWTTANDAPASSMSCPGTKHQQTCRLRPAIVNYPVQIEAYPADTDKHASASMALGINDKKSDSSIFRNFNMTGKQQNYFEVLSYNDIQEVHNTGLDSRTRLGGIAQGLSIYLAGDATISYGGTAGYYIQQTSNAPSYLENDLGVQTAGANFDADFKCGYQYSDPMNVPLFQDNTASTLPQYMLPNIYGKINQIMFALALDISNEDDDADKDSGTLSRPGLMYEDTVHYKTIDRFKWAAFASTIFCVLLVLPLYWGYWQLGRAVTLGPFEIAAAFRAPNLYHPSNAPIEDLIKEVGDRKVRFGQIVSGGDAGRIGVAEPEYVDRIHPSAKPREMRKSWRVSRMQSPTEK